MALILEIADRLYDYSDEEKALIALQNYQYETGMDDDTIIMYWETATHKKCAQRDEIQHVVYQAIDMNGSFARAAKSIPAGVTITKI